MTIGFSILLRRNISTFAQLTEIFGSCSLIIDMDVRASGRKSMMLDSLVAQRLGVNYAMGVQISLFAHSLSYRGCAKRTLINLIGFVEWIARAKSERRAPMLTLYYECTITIIAAIG